MTAGQIAAPYRQIRTSLLFAALAVAFGIGLLIGLVAQRAANPGALAITNVGAAAVVVGANSRAGAPAGITGDGQNFRGEQDFRAATGGSSIGVTPALDPKPYLTVQDGIVVPPSSSAIKADGQDFRGAQDFRAAARGDSFAVTPVLDPKPYLTVQDGIVVPPSSSAVTPVLDTKPYLTVQDGSWSRRARPL
jgi:hypothetical protein